MIESLQNVTFKSFDNYSTPDDIKFKNKNIIFGENGQGKSSLARILWDGFVRSGQSEANIRYFHRDYVKDNISVSSDDGLKGVYANFGKDNIDLGNEIQELKQDIKKKEEDKKGIEKRIQDSIDETNKEVLGIHKSFKGDTKIQVRSTTENPEKILEEYRRLDVEKYKDENTNQGQEVYNINDVLYTCSDIENFSPSYETLEQNKKDIEDVPELSVPNIDHLCNNFNSISNVLNNSYSDSNIPPLDIIEWITQGINLHKSESDCLFCGNNPINLENIQRAVDDYNADTKVADTKKLKEYQQDLQKFVRDAEEFDRLPWCGQSIKQDSFKVRKNTYFQSIEQLIGIIDQKIQSMNSPIDNLPLTHEELEDFSNYLTVKKKEFSEAKNKALQDIESKIDSINAIAKLKVALKVLSNNNISGYINNFKNAKLDLKNVNNEIEALKKKLKDKEESAADIAPFMEFLNSVLYNQLNLNFKLSLNESKDKYIIQTLDNQDISIYDISEGEKNLFALLYFYYEMYNDEEQKSPKDGISLVLVDDPVSSLDYANRSYVLRIVDSILKDFSQAFIFTHSIEDFADICYFWKNNKDASILRVRKDYEAKSYIEKAKDFETPYSMLFKEIYSISTSKNTLTLCEINHSPNSMRRVFEEFLKFKTSRGILPQISKIDDIKQVYKIATGKEMSKGMSRRLETLLGSINISSHRSTQLSEITIKDSAKTLMKIIEEMDKLHFNNMKS